MAGRIWQAPQDRPRAAASGEYIVTPNPEPGGGAVSPADYETLEQRALTVPVEGVSAAEIEDTFNDARSGSGPHQATDIPAPAGTPVIAADDGVLKKLFYSVRGGLTIYEFDSGGDYCYYYAHLEHYAEGLHDGQIVKRGDRLGSVGVSGDAIGSEPHLHFAIFKLGPQKHWWQGTALNPYPILRNH